MAIEVAEDTTTAIEWYPDVGLGISSATATVYDSTGTQTQTGSVTVDSVSTTLSSVTSDTEIVVASATGITAGRRYLLTTQEGPAIVLVERVNSTTVYLAERPMGTVRASDTFKGIRLTYSITTATSATRQKNCRVQFAITLSDSSVQLDQAMLHVVAMPFGNVVSASDVAMVLQAYGSSQWARLGSGKAMLIAEQANFEVRQAIEKHDRYPHLYGDRSKFKAAGIAAIQMILAKPWGIVPAASQSDAVTWYDHARLDFERKQADAVAALNWYDSNDDQIPDTQEQRGLRFAEFRT